jgi:hypothetical protein
MTLLRLWPTRSRRLVWRRLSWGGASAACERQRRPMAHPVDRSRAEGIGVRRTVSVCGQHGICQSQTSNLDRLGVGGVV